MCVGVCVCECGCVCVCVCVCVYLVVCMFVCYPENSRDVSLGPSWAAGKTFFFTNVLIQGLLLRPRFVPEKVDVSQKNS